jgi:hypothetical protein
MLTQEQAEKRACENIEWELEAVEMLKFIKDNAIGEDE